MPRLRTATNRVIDQQVMSAETGYAAPIGPAVIELVSLGFRANVPVLLIGSHGLGKSQITAEAAKILNVDCITLDLSLMEPPELVGLPKVDDGATRFIPPEILPRESGRGGILLLEELNRAPRYMSACALELLTSRRLNSYRLPANWLPMACINPKNEGYHVDVLDAAIMSRFMRIEVRASEETWLAWAHRSGIHPKIIEYVGSVPNSLNESAGGSNPRSWAYASHTLQAAGEKLLEKSPDTVITALVGLIGPVHTTALMRLILGTEAPLKPSDVLHNWPTAKSMIRRWRTQGRLDLLTASMRAILAWVRPDATADELRRNPEHAAIVQQFVMSIGGDLTEQARGCLLECGHTFLISDHNGGSGPKAGGPARQAPAGSGSIPAQPGMRLVTRRQLGQRRATSSVAQGSNGSPK